MEADQAKFMWVRVDLQIDETLRRGGYITNAQGGNLWVMFKYQRLQIWVAFKYIYNDVHNGIMMLEILQILVSQIKKKSNIHLLCSLGPPITFICTSICVFYVVKFVELLAFFKIM